MNILADENIPLVRELFGTLGDIHTLPGRRITPAEVREADLLLVRSVTRVDASLVEESRVRFIATATAGIDHVDVEALGARGVAFASAPGSNAAAVADYVAAALLRECERSGYSLAGKRMGIIGHGEVGARVASRARALGMAVILNDPPLARQTGQPRYRPLDELLDTADIVTLHVPLTRTGPDRTERMVDAAFLARMRSGCLFVNASRGKVVDEEALVAALDAGHLRTALLDVWATEPKPDPRTVERAALATAHIAGYSLDGKLRGTWMIYEAACRFLGRAPRGQFNDYLPPAQFIVPPSSLRPASHEHALAEVVRRVMDLDKDDAALRRCAALSPTERTAGFDAARSMHGDRREFSSCIVEWPGAAPEVRGALASLGFQLH